MGELAGTTELNSTLYRALAAFRTPCLYEFALKLRDA
jgi:hypothetical protein